ncbi:MAG TPA: CoA transferase [Nocardia sp.]|uniref:CoA transferase n=1 Tax=Nocardia sp. TaxID=1821 RepID=UPI002B4AC75C|nr:CoA transferase [Nocardia sp.]HLS76493.1 CoA transferase [Nocardia sp.]
MWTPGSADRVRDWAESGVVALTGRADGAPVVPPGHAASRARALGAWIAEASGGAVRVDGARLLAERAAFTGFHRAGSVSAGGACRLLPTADGWAAVSCARPDDPPLLAALAYADLADDDPWPAVAAWLAGHTGAELAERAELLGIAAWPVTTPRASAVPVPLAPRPVAGLLVVDFSALWAGPLCAHLLGLAGARIVKVETPSRPDGARRGHPGFYRLLHGGHSAVRFDPAVPGDRAAMHALAGAADIVIEASRPRALRGFGLEAEDFVAAGATWISITAAGRASNRIGFGDDIAASAGLVAHDADGPMFVGDAIADPLTGLTAAALAMSTPAGGAGMLWDVSMTDVVAATLEPAEGPAPQVRRDGARWTVETATGPAAIADPRPRRPRGVVAEPGRDTEAVLAELGISR